MNERPIVVVINEDGSWKLTCAPTPINTFKAEVLCANGIDDCVPPGTYHFDVIRETNGDLTLELLKLAA